jgi:hypothetical protein
MNKLPDIIRHLQKLRHNFRLPFPLAPHLEISAYNSSSPPALICAVSSAENWWWWWWLLLWLLLCWLLLWLPRQQ